MTSTPNHQPPATALRSHTSHHSSEAWMGYVTNRWSRMVGQPILITLMVTAFVTGPLTVLQLFVPATPWRTLTFVFFFLILETAYTTLWLQQPGQRPLNRLAYRAAEFLVFIILIRLLTWALTDSWPDRETWQVFLFEPILLFADSFFLVAALAAFITWQMTMQITDLFGELALDRAEAAYYADAFGHHKLETRPTIVDRGQLIAGFLHQWLFGGLTLAVCAALATFDWSNPAPGRTFFGIGRLPLPQSMLLSLIFYFLAGFLLLSQGRLALMNARWLINGVQKNDRLERSWYRFSLRLLAIIAFVAALLPLGSTFALSQIVAAIIAGLTAIFTFIMALFVGLLSLLLSRAGSQGDRPIPTIPSEPLVMPTPPPPTETAETVRMIASSAFWALAIVFSVMAILFFLRERHVSLTGNTWRQWWTAVSLWWRTLWQSVSQQVVTTRRAIRSRRRQRSDERTINLPRWRFVRLNTLSPRDQLRYFYLSTVERAGKSGVNRRQSETPLEFAQDLKENWPDAEADVETVTDAFLQARYSPQPIETEQVHPIKERWKRLRARLRRRQGK